MGRVTARRGVLRIDTANGSPVTRPDTIAAEEPLEVRVDKRPLAVTMRTPGHDLDLALGFLFTEGVIRSPEDVRTAQLCAGDQEPNTYNVVEVSLAAGVPAPVTDPSRNFYTTSSCGVCGKASIDAVRTRSAYPVAADPAQVSATTLTGLPGTLRKAQRTFESTGGLHAAGLFTVDGELIAVREDVGRHNAVDKVVGWALRDRRMAGIPVLAAVSAPSTLAVELADEVGLTVVGFLRGTTMNVYTRPDRITPPTAR
ncbi:MAG: sufurtransferase FdhD [Actinobacteria bacterium 13_1_20CM_3_71_11]|nr:MAG: sufurtransferase FdhD [Actinobacteria bacterium 13_1_20CM_3_71_11]